MKIIKTKSFLILLVLFFIGALIVKVQDCYAQNSVDVGIAKIDITPKMPIRLAGYAAREQKETTKILSELSAEAIAFGDNPKTTTLIITVDLVGVTKAITNEVSKYLKTKYGIPESNLVISASHTHGGPEIGNLINTLLYEEDGFEDVLLPKEELIHIAHYVEGLIQKLKEVSDRALIDRRPRLISWNQGQALFAKNRAEEGGPVDVALPFMSINEPDGTLRAVYLNYACHGTTLGPINEIHGDWIVEAKNEIESRHPGVTALISLGAGGDANPSPRGSIEDVVKHGKEIADNVDKLLKAQLQPLNRAPSASHKWIKLPLSRKLTIPEIITLSEKKSVKGYQARLTLEQLLRGSSFPEFIEYPIQVFNFDDKMVMINLGGEVVVDYSFLLKAKYGAERLWVNAYANHVPGYIPSKRVINFENKDYDYEREDNMYWYGNPIPFSPRVEDIILNTVDELIPEVFKEYRPQENKLKTVLKGTDGNYYLNSWDAATEGENIDYMPEWKSFGWFNTEDKAIWEVNLESSGKYDVYLEYSVSDAEANKSFCFSNEKKEIMGKAISTGSWFTFKTVKIGTIKLKRGANNFYMRTNNTNEKGPLFDLRKITLKPY